MRPVPILGIVNLKSNPGAVTRAIKNQGMAVFRLARMFVLPVIKLRHVLLLKYKQQRQKQSAAVCVIIAEIKLVLMEVIILLFL